MDFVFLFLKLKAEIVGKANSFLGENDAFAQPLIITVAQCVIVYTAIEIVY